MNKSAVDQAQALLHQYIAHQPKEQIIRQIGIILERVKFIPDPDSLLSNKDYLQVKSSLNFLFQQDISQPMQSWLDELVNQGLATVLIGQPASQLYQQVQEQLQQLHEIKVVTAIALAPQLQDSLAGQLLANRPQARVVFEVLPSIMGGCLIIEGQDQIHDYSIKSNLGKYSKEFMQKKLQQIKS